jgi:UDP-GlcNAc:undecaprenyl-phosphate GlcNAc-1-phosphate transferase
MPHRQHLYQRLVLAGWSHQAVAVIYGGLAAAGGLIAISWMGGPR